MDKDTAKKKVDAEAKRAEIATKLIDSSKNVLIIMGIVIVVAWVVIKYVFSGDRKTRKLMDIITGEADKRIDEKNKLKDEMDKKIRDIRAEREKKLREIDEADDSDLNDIIRRRGL